MSPILIKKKPISIETADKYEKANPSTQINSSIEARRKTAYPNEPGQFPIILSNLFNIDLHQYNIGYAKMPEAVEFCKQIFEILEKCEFFDFKDDEYKLLVSTLNDLGCKEYDKIHPYYKPTGIRNIAKTLGLKDNIEAPLEIFDRLNKSENFDFMRILIQNGALRKWISAQEEKTTNKNNSSNSDAQNEINETPAEPGE